MALRLEVEVGHYIDEHTGDLAWSVSIELGNGTIRDFVGTDVGETFKDALSVLTFDETEASLTEMEDEE